MTWLWNSGLCPIARGPTAHKCLAHREGPKALAGIHYHPKARVLRSSGNLNCYISDLVLRVTPPYKQWSLTTGSSWWDEMTSGVLALGTDLPPPLPLHCMHAACAGQSTVLSGTVRAHIVHRGLPLVVASKEQAPASLSRQKGDTRGPGPWQAAYTQTHWRPHQSTKLVSKLVIFSAEWNYKGCAYTCHTHNVHTYTQHTGLNQETSLPLLKEWAAHHKDLHTKPVPLIILGTWP